jgi:hypothetical protein
MQRELKMYGIGDTDLHEKLENEKNRLMNVMTTTVVEKLGL